MVDICPSSFWSLAVCPADTWSVVEREGCLAFGDVSSEVKLGHHKSKFEPFVVEMVLGRKQEHPLPKMDAPLAAYIVGHDKRKEGGGQKARKEKVVHIRVSK